MIQMSQGLAYGKPFLRGGEVLPASAADIPPHFGGNVPGRFDLGAGENMKNLLAPLPVMGLQCLTAAVEIAVNGPMGGQRQSDSQGIDSAESL